MANQNKSPMRQKSQSPRNSMKKGGGGGFFAHALTAQQVLKHFNVDPNKGLTKSQVMDHTEQ